MPDTPLYGRPYAFACECPACGELLIVRSASRAVSTTKLDAPAEHIWQPLASLLTCPACGRYWVVGLSLYALEVVAPTIKLPHDQRLSLRQAAIVRARVGGAWVLDEPEDHAPKRPGEQHPKRRTNRTEACTCEATGREGCTRHRRSWGQ